MFEKLPLNDYQKFMSWTWADLEPYYQDLVSRELSADNAIAWLTDWSRLGMVVWEIYSRLYVATTLNTKDEDVSKRFMTFVGETLEHVQKADQKIKEKLLASGLQPEGYEIALRNIQTQAEIFREENVPLNTEEQNLGHDYDKVIGAQTVEWEGETKTLAQLRALLIENDRDLRERAWRAMMQRTLADRQKLNDLWKEFLKVRAKMAANADMADFRSFMWRTRLRFDYTPEDCLRFHDAIEKTVVPAMMRINEKRARHMGIPTIRPWDTLADALGRPPLRPFNDGTALSEVSARIFHQVDPQLGAYFDKMRAENMLDLVNYDGKAPGGYQTLFPASRVPFIFMNAVGIHDDVQTMLHEGGHAFHSFESFASLPDYQQGEVPIEFAEVASMSMELLAAPYLSTDKGGFYSAADAARARIDHLEHNLWFWPYMSVVDAFQHWVYTNMDAAANPDNCDEEWSRLWDRFMPFEDWSGLDAEKETGWHRKLHIFQIPFYYVEYGLAQLGATQIFGNALKDQSKAVADYRKALALGGTVSLPKLFEAAGAKFAMDVETVGAAVRLTEQAIAELEAQG